jgi:hypothetical protein
LLEMSAMDPYPQLTLRGRPNQIMWLEAWDTQHCQLQDCICNHKCTATKYQCTKCKIGLCIEPYFRIYHTQVNFWIMSSSHHRNHFRKCTCCTFHYNNILFYFSNQKLFFQKDIFYY